MNGSQTCLLVEDDPGDQEYFIEALHSISKTTGCFVVNDGEEALYALREDELRPDFIFTDLVMPRMNGYEFIKVLRQTRDLRNIPVIVYSGVLDEAVVRKLKALGVLACYEKSPDGITQIMREYFGKSALLGSAAVRSPGQ